MGGEGCIGHWRGGRQVLSAELQRFPPVLPDPAACFSARLGRDSYLRFETNDYSVNPRFIGRRIDVSVDREYFVATCAGTEVARHRRCLASHRELLDPAHAITLRRMREVAPRSPSSTPPSRSETSPTTARWGWRDGGQD